VITGFDLSGSLLFTRVYLRLSPGGCALKDFYQTEKFKIQVAAATAGVAYVVAIIMLWLRLRHIYGSYVYPVAKGVADHGQSESFAAWLAPWCVYLAITALVSVMAAILVIYFRSFNDKGPCVDCCVLLDLTNYTSSRDDVAQQHVCPGHLAERRDATALEAARERARAETVGNCPRCHQPMVKGIQVVLGIYVVSDVCRAHGWFREFAEEELFMEEAYLAGLHARPRRFSRRSMEGHIITAAALHANTGPILYLDDSGSDAAASLRQTARQVGAIDALI